jgi:hypothetical protein
VRPLIDQNADVRSGSKAPFQPSGSHFWSTPLPKVATEMALHVLAYNLTRVLNIVGVKPLLAAVRA